MKRRKTSLKKPYYKKRKFRGEKTLFGHKECAPLAKLLGIFHLHALDYNIEMPEIDSSKDISTRLYKL